MTCFFFGGGEERVFFSQRRRRQFGIASGKRRDLHATETFEERALFSLALACAHLSVTLDVRSSTSFSISPPNCKEKKASERTKKGAAFAFSERTCFNVGGASGSAARRDVLKGGDARLPVFVLCALAQREGRGRGELRGLVVHSHGCAKR